jgi:hypothetical protein
MNDNGTYNPDAPLQERTGLTPTVRTWTVAGVWYKNEQLAVAVIEGDHVNRAHGAVDDMDESEDLHESWTVTVQAPDAETAELTALARDDDEEVPSHRNDFGDWCPFSGSRTSDGTCPQFCEEADDLAGFDAGRDECDDDDDNEEEA